MKAIDTSLSNEYISRRRGRSILSSSIVHYQTPRTLPATSNNFNREFVLRGRSQVVNHQVEVGGIAIRVVPDRLEAEVVHVLVLGVLGDQAVSDDVVPGVRYDLVPG
jgi:hypothetical protein